MITDATISPDGRYRYDLTRRWADGPLAAWIGLNPSTADETEDDPTIRRILRFTRDWLPEFGGIVMLNLFAMRSTRPVHLTEADDPVGRANELTIRAWLNSTPVEAVVLAWGAWYARPAVIKAMADKRPPDVRRIAHQAGHKPLVLGYTAEGAPKHPLYVKADTPLINA